VGGFQIGGGEAEIPNLTPIGEPVLRRFGLLCPGATVPSASQLRRYATECTHLSLEFRTAGLLHPAVIAAVAPVLLLISVSMSEGEDGE